MTNAATKSDDTAKSSMQINVHAEDKIIPIIISNCISWGTICQKLVENSFTVDAELVIQMLTKLSPKERFTHYVIRYGDENATIFCVQWSSARIPGYARVPLVAGYIEANMTLEIRGEGPLQSAAKPHLLVQPAEMEDHPSPVDVDLCTSLVSINSSTGITAIDYATTQEPFQCNAARMSVVHLREHDSFLGFVRSFSTSTIGCKSHLLPGTICMSDSPSANASAGTKRKTPAQTENVGMSKSSKKKKKKKKDRSKPITDNNEGTKKPDEKDETSAKKDTEKSSAADITKKPSGAAAMKESVGKPDASNTGGLRSIVDPYFSQRYSGVMDAAFKVLDDLFLYPSHAPWIEGPGLCLAAESCYGNPAMINLQRNHYLRQSFSKTDLASIPVDDNTRNCYVYGAGYGSVTFGTVEEQLAYRQWTNDMQIIADAIEKELVHQFSSDEGVDVNVHLNELEVISFYDSKRITFHRDQSYSAKGEFMENNCQKQHTCTCIYVLGDERVLEFQLFLGKKKLNHPEAEKMIRLTNGALFFLHPKDEEDSLRQLFKMNEKTHFKHRNNGVEFPGQLSIGFVFRTCVQTRTVYKGTGQLVLNSESKPTNTALVCERKLKDYEECWTKPKMDEYLKNMYLSMKERHHTKQSLMNCGAIVEVDEERRNKRRKKSEWY